MKMNLKTCIVGDSEVGKTSIILRIIENSFKQGTTTTIGVDYKYQEV
jgi:GTPase SAR1 family protein